MTLQVPNEIINDTPADAIPIDSNYKAIEQYVNTQAVHRDGSIAMTGQLTLIGDPISDNHAARKQYVDAVLPVGVMLPWLGVAAPAGQWALANGATLQTTTYPELYNVLGTRYGGSGGNFMLPNMAGLVPIGVKDADTRFTPVGKKGGSFTVPIPEHDHKIDHNHPAGSTGTQSANHTHTVPAHAHSIAHNHAAGTSGGASAYSHAHSISRFVAQIGTGNLGLQAGGQGQPLNLTDSDTGSGGVAHTHSVDLGTFTGNSGNSSTLTSGSNSVGHSHTMDVAAFAGSSAKTGVAAAEQIPPYVAINYIVRIA